MNRLDEGRGTEEGAWIDGVLKGGREGIEVKRE